VVEAYAIQVLTGGLEIGEGPGSERAPVLRCYPVVRWTDRWGTCWEYRLGKVRQVDMDDSWEP
jgi:hypothetical protein